MKMRSGWRWVELRQQLAQQELALALVRCDASANPSEARLGIASGSFAARSMVVAPCSIKTSAWGVDLFGLDAGVVRRWQ